MCMRVFACVFALCFCMFVCVSCKLGRLWLCACVFVCALVCEDIRVCKDMCVCLYDLEEFAPPLSVHVFVRACV